MSINRFINYESLSGVLLILMAFLALFLANSPLSFLYDALLDTPVAIKVGKLIVDKPLLLWINDGLMAIFFFLIGLEIKRELLAGELSSFNKAILPVIAACGGLIVPALIYYFFNKDNAALIDGWGVPVATDIAFALGVLSLLSDRVPSSLKVLLLSLAIIDDLAAIVIIAIFYTDDLSTLALMLSASGFVVAMVMNVFNVRRVAAYVLVGVFMWVCVLKSGVHATLAGVALAFTIPLKIEKGPRIISPLKTLEHALHPWISYFIMPVFAFANAGVSLDGFSIDALNNTLSIGIITGLFVGKQLGVFSFVFLSTMLGLCKLPDDINWKHLYGLALLTGIGFTMSLFIGTLAFDDPVIGTQVRIAVLIASGLSAVCGYAFLRLIKR